MSPSTFSEQFKVQGWFFVHHIIIIYNCLHGIDEIVYSISIRLLKMSARIVRIEYFTRNDSNYAATAIRHIYSSMPLTRRVCVECDTQSQTVTYFPTGIGAKVACDGVCRANELDIFGSFVCVCTNAN